VERARGSTVESSAEASESRLAGAGAAGEGEDLSAGERRRDVIHSADGGGAKSIVAGDAVELDGEGAVGRGHVEVG